MSDLGGQLNGAGRSAHDSEATKMGLGPGILRICGDSHTVTSSMF